MSGINKSYLFILNGKNQKQSKKERKEIIRQTLYEEYLKKVPYPHLLEPEDVKSNNVLLYNKLKNVKSSVRVLNRWKYKNLFPQSYIKKNITIPIAFNFNLDENNIDTRIFPKLGVTSVNPRELAEAFKPFNEPLTGPLTGPGEIFDFSWKFELKQCVPGRISQELKDALGIKGKAPPPWLFKMQEMGPPPGWPNVLYQGVNCGIPNGCSYGYEPNGWGKPSKQIPVDELKDELNLVNQYTSLQVVDNLLQDNIISMPLVEDKEEMSICQPVIENNKRKVNLKDQIRKKFKF